MARERNDLNASSSVVGTVDGDWNDNARLITRVDLAADLRGEVIQAAAQRERVIVRQEGEDLAAIIPIADLALLLRLEEAEEDRIDIEAAGKALADPENQERIPWALVKAELGR